VDAGSALVGKAGQTMEEIVGSIKRVTDIMGEISAASQEQTSGIEQINQAITQMDQVTQQNAALVEEAAAAAQSLQQQTGTLVHTVSVFKLAANADADRVIAQAKAKSHAAAPLPVTSRAVAKVSARHAAKENGGAAQPAPQLATADAGAGDWKEF